MTKNSKLSAPAPHEMGTAKLLSLPKSELKYIRMCDVPLRTMQRILKEVSQ